MESGSDIGEEMGDPSCAKLRVDLNKLVFERSDQGRGFLFNPKSGEVFSLNRTGAFIMDALQVSMAAEELTRKVALEFGVDVTTARADVGEFTAELKQMGLIVCQGEEPS